MNLVKASLRPEAVHVQLETHTCIGDTVTPDYCIYREHV